MQGEIAELLKHFIMGFSALLPLVNPFGSALSVIAIVGLESEETYKSLARKIATSTVLFFMAIGLVDIYFVGRLGATPLAALSFWIAVPGFEDSPLASVEIFVIVVFRSPT